MLLYAVFSTFYTMWVFSPHFPRASVHFYFQICCLQMLSGWQSVKAFLWCCFNKGMRLQSLQPFQINSIGIKNGLGQYKAKLLYIHDLICYLLEKLLIYMGVDTGTAGATLAAPILSVDHQYGMPHRHNCGMMLHQELIVIKIENVNNR